MSETKTYYATTASNHPGGSGYWEVTARDYHEARDRVFEAIGDKWAFLYDDFDKVHPMDRIRHGKIG